MHADRLVAPTCSTPLSAHSGMASCSACGLAACPWLHCCRARCCCCCSCLLTALPQLLQYAWHRLLLLHRCISPMVPALLVLLLRAHPAACCSTVGCLRPACQAACQPHAPAVLPRCSQLGGARTPAAAPSRVSRNACRLQSFETSLPALQSVLPLLAPSAPHPAAPSRRGAAAS